MAARLLAPIIKSRGPGILRRDGSTGIFLRSNGRSARQGFDFLGWGICAGGVALYVGLYWLSRR